MPDLLVAFILILICLAIILIYKVSNLNVCMQKDSYTYKAKTFLDEQMNPIKVSELFGHEK